MIKKYGILFLAILSVGAFVTYICWQQINRSKPPEVEATWLKGGKPLTSFQLIDFKGQPFTLESLKGKWSLIFLGYTYCPDICPTTLATMRQVYHSLTDSKTPLPQVVFVSVDPERDDLNHLKEYVTFFNSEFLGVTGELKELNQLADQLGVLFAKNEPKASEKTYLIDHGASILLINPAGVLQAIWSMPHSATTIANDYRKILNYSQS